MCVLSIKVPIRKVWKLIVCTSYVNSKKILTFERTDKMKRFINFNGISTRLGLSYVLMFGNHCIFIFIFFKLLLSVLFFTHTYTHTQIHKHMHTHSDTHTYTHTHIYTYIYIYIYIYIFFHCFDSLPFVPGHFYSLIYIYIYCNPYLLFSLSN